MLALSSAWLCCTSWPSTVMTSEIPTLGPRVRIRRALRRPFVAVARRQRRERDRRQRHEDEAEPDSLDDARRDDVGNADLRGPVRHCAEPRTPPHQTRAT